MTSEHSKETNGTAAKSTTNGSAPVNPNQDMASIEQDISHLSAILSGPALTETNAQEELDERSLAELFKQLEGATGLMNGVEDKLDNVLGNLDGLLAALEEKNAQGGKLEEEKTSADTEDPK